MSVRPYQPRQWMVRGGITLLTIGILLLLPFRQASLFAAAAAQEPLPPDGDLAHQLSAIEPLLPSFYLGMQLLPSLPALIGQETPQRYLLVMQNSDELRATGGFISALGLLTLDRGQVSDLAFVDSYRLYRADKEYPPAPAPMTQFMDIHYLLLRDANWSPDFPTTAALLQALYREETGITVNGIISVDLHAVELLVGALAPLRMPNVDEPLTGANVLAQVKALWTQPVAGASIDQVGLGTWWGQRKDFIPALAAAVMEKLRSGGVDYVTVTNAVERSLNERAMQIWLADPVAAAQVKALGWDGRLQARTDADYLSLIDTNMGYNKANAVVERTLAYTVTWPAVPDQPPIADVTIEYHHPLTVTDHVCDLTPRYGSGYEDLVARCFFNYVRLYVPGGSQLLTSDGLQAASLRSMRGEAGTQVFAGYFVLPPGERLRVHFQYQLPARLTPANYRLLLQRQAGAGPLSFTVVSGQARRHGLLRYNTLWWQPGRE